jgi:hypothetical protein
VGKQWVIRRSGNARFDRSRAVGFSCKNPRRRIALYLICTDEMYRRIKNAENAQNGKGKNPVKQTAASNNLHNHNIDCFAKVCYTDNIGHAPVMPIACSNCGKTFCKEVFPRPFKNFQLS